VLTEIKSYSAESCRAAVASAAVLVDATFAACASHMQDSFALVDALVAHQQTWQHSPPRL
jgi:hypothetical protein